MEALKGTIQSYDRKTGEGLIFLDSQDDPVCVDLKSSAGICLKRGQRGEFARIHRPKGIYAFSLKLI